MIPHLTARTSAWSSLMAAPLDCRDCPRSSPQSSTRSPPAAPAPAAPAAAAAPTTAELPEAAPAPAAAAAKESPAAPAQAAASATVEERVAALEAYITNGDPSTAYTAHKTKNGKPDPTGEFPKDFKPTVLNTQDLDITAG